MIRPPFLQQGYAGKRQTPGWAGPLLGLAFLFAGAIIGNLLFSSTIGRWQPSPSLQQNDYDPFAMIDVTIISAGVGLMMIFVLYLWLKFYEQRPMKTLGLWQPAVPRLLRGVAAGLIAVTIIAFILVVFCGADFSIRLSHSSLPALLLAFLIIPAAFLVTATTEEMVFCGFIFQTVGFKYGLITGATVTSLLWGILHFEGGMPVFLYFAGVSVFSFLLCLYAVTENSLWGPIGFNASWNFSMHTIFDITVVDADNSHIEVENALSQSPGLFTIESETAYYSVAILITLTIMLVGMIVLRPPSRH